MRTQSTLHTEGTASAKIIADSIFCQSRLVSVEVEFPRPYLAEFNTHRQFSRNSASSRAIPTWKRLRMVLERPYIPNSFGRNKAGMQAGDSLSDTDREKTVRNWLAGRDAAVIQAYCLAGGRNQILQAAKNHTDAIQLCDIIEAEIMPRYPDVTHAMTTLDEGLHKQHANRPLETYSFHTVIVTSSYWRNFFGLRPSKHAQPEAQDFGIAIARAIMHSTPVLLQDGEWHLPYIYEDDRVEESDPLMLARIACARCARTSYLTHDGVRSHTADLEMVDGLQKNGHMSPFEHVAQATTTYDETLCGNFDACWVQYRKTLQNEHDFLRVTSPEDLLLGCRGDAALRDFILGLRY